MIPLCVLVNLLWILYGFPPLRISKETTSLHLFSPKAWLRLCLKFSLAKNFLFARIHWIPHLLTNCNPQNRQRSLQI